MKRNTILWWIGLTTIFIGFLALWAVTGGLWEPQPRSIDFKLRAKKQQLQPHAGAAERYRNQWYAGTDVPGFTEIKMHQKPTDEPPTGLVNQAMNDLAKKLSVPIENVTLQVASPRVFLDDRLGCAAPGEINVAMQTPGWMLRLKTSDQLYQYNVSSDGQKMEFCGTE